MLTVEFILITCWHRGNAHAFSSLRGRFEYALALMLLYTAIFCRGAAPYSIDRMRVLRRQFTPQ